ncbi:hypothetical protein FB45DRAFT_1037616 [Roridomyces roridus]|uniref:Acyl-CoA dehydrogenase NM domain-like protein n=1 Tax=Roridomyces roridus TaxID=1738132 RepID=A0AAD7FC13_9AGAR|nr:hypothetical protein FB45DRAFT_1037616 [Roridomyces roridus]
MLQVYSILPSSGMVSTKSAVLASTPLFQRHSTALPWTDRIKLSYDRARAISRLYDLEMNDVLTVSEKYWAFQRDPIHLMDGAAGTLLTIHYNLCLGTISMFPEGKAELVKKLLAFEISGQYCLTELGHGLDAIHLETTATLLETGELEINTPTEAAAKFMPPTTPSGIPCVAVVFARLIVNGVDKGIKPILVPLHDGREMYPGVTSNISPIVLQQDIRGASIAEGDILGISIRFAIDLIMGRVSAPASLYPEDILFQHESSILAELREIVRSAGRAHGREAIDRLILPRCQELIRAVGDRLAVEAARQRNVDPLVVDLYIASVVKEDGAWFSEHGGISQETQRRMEREAVEALYPRLRSLLDRLEIAEYVTAPIVSDERWKSSFEARSRTDSAVVEARL